LDERTQKEETMRRENRRVQAMSWGSSGSDDPAPPKPSRLPTDGHSGYNTPPTQPSLVSTYIVAQNPEVLMQLMRENEGRVLNPAVYTMPASAFNTLAVDFMNGGAASSSTTSTLSSTSEEIPLPPPPTDSGLELATSFLGPPSGEPVVTATAEQVGGVLAVCVRCTTPFIIWTHEIDLNFKVATFKILLHWFTLLMFREVNRIDEKIQDGNFFTLSITLYWNVVDLSAILSAHFLLLFISTHF
jgi:hypothetical protein